MSHRRKNKHHARHRTHAVKPANMPAKVAAPVVPDVSDAEMNKATTDAENLTHEEPTATTTA